MSPEPKDHYRAGQGEQFIWGNLTDAALRSLAANEGYGCCALGGARGWVCVFGGIGCNVDHLAIKGMFRAAQGQEHDNAVAELRRLKEALNTVRCAANL